MKMEIEIDDKVISSILCNAFEGGSNYWYEIVGYDYADGITESDFHEGGKFQDKDTYFHPSQLVPLHSGCAVVIKADGDKKKYRLNRGAIERGLKVMVAKYAKHFGDMMSEHDDADTGDVFLQCCLFGEVVYG
jgi:hypothetical protein